MLTIDIDAPVDARELGLYSFDFAPMPAEDHPLHPMSDWNLYGRPLTSPWGSYLSLEPIPLRYTARGAMARVIAFEGASR